MFLRHSFQLNYALIIASGLFDTLLGQLRHLPVLSE